MDSSDSSATSSPRNKSPASATWRRDESFYMKDVVFVVFLVEDVLFRMPRQIFEDQSEVFRDMFSLPVPDGRAAEGTDDDNPLFLENVGEDDFRALLCAISPPKEKELTFNEWISVLKLSRKWLFHKIHDLAIKNVSAMVQDPIRRIVIARQHDIRDWLIPEINTLVSRVESLKSHEIAALGPAFSAKIAEVREDVALVGCACTCYYCVTVHGAANIRASATTRSSRSGHDFSSKIRSVFGAEVE